MPPLALSGKDPSTKKEDELFSVDLDVDGKTLAASLAPPGVKADMARELGEAALDVIALPGKTYHATEKDDTADDIQASLAELTSLRRQELNGETTRFDSKWTNANRTTLRTIKDIDDLQDHLRDVQAVGPVSMKRVVTKQRTILSRMAWQPIEIQIWSHGGYITVISRASFQLYQSLLLHLLEVDRDLSWPLAKQELDFYNKKFTLIRSNSDSRLQAMCRIYVLLRDNAEADWRSSKLEYEKLAALHQKVCSLSLDSFICKKCGTALHGPNACPWMHLSNNNAKKTGRKVLQGLAKGVVEVPETEEADSGPDPKKKKKRPKKKAEPKEEEEDDEAAPGS